MHTALELEELLRTIAEYVQASSGLGVNPKRDLLSMALTCRRFYRPAIECLWYNLNSLFPILHCLPSDICSKSDQGYFEVSSNIFL